MPEKLEENLFDSIDRTGHEFSEELPVTDEERELGKKAGVAKGESKLPRKDFIRLIALRYMRGGMRGDVYHYSLSEEDATELATIERDIDEAGGMDKVPQEVLNRMSELRKKLESGI